MPAILDNSGFVIMTTVMTTHILIYWPAWQWYFYFSVEREWVEGEGEVEGGKRQPDRQADRQRHTERQTGRQTETHRETDAQTETDRQIETETEKKRHTQRD